MLVGREKPLGRNRFKKKDENNIKTPIALEYSNSIDYGQEQEA